jgi:hypothetical protein
MMNGKRPDWLKSVRAAVGNPTVGQALYNLNMNKRVVEIMATPYGRAPSQVLN